MTVNPPSRSKRSLSQVLRTVVVDTQPLVRLTQLNALRTLTDFADRAVVVDVVKDQAMYFLDAECQRRLTAWLDAGAAREGGMWVDLEPTTTGRVLAAAQRVIPGFRWRNANQFALVEYMHYDLHEVASDTNAPPAAEAGGTEDQVDNGAAAEKEADEGSELRVVLQGSFRLSELLGPELSYFCLSLRMFLERLTDNAELWKQLAATSPDIASEPYVAGGICSFRYPRS